MSKLDDESKEAWINWNGGPHSQPYSFEAGYRAAYAKYALQSDQLEPCPFCGSEIAAVIIAAEELDGNSGDYTVVCNVHKSGCGAVCGYSGNREEAIKKWNTRV